MKFGKENTEMKNKYKQNEQCHPLDETTAHVHEKKKRPGFRPYVKNTMSVSCAIYKNDVDSGPVTQHEVSASFRVRIIPLMIALAVSAAVVFLVNFKKK